MNKKSIFLIFIVIATIAIIYTIIDSKHSGSIDISNQDFDVRVNDFEVEVKDFEVFNSDVDLEFNANAVINNMRNDFIEMTLFLSDFEDNKSKVLDENNIYGYFQFIHHNDTINVLAEQKEVHLNSESNKDNRISLVLDFSRSMFSKYNRDDKYSNILPIEHLIKAVNRFINLKNSDDQISIIKFASSNVVSNFNKNTSFLEDFLKYHHRIGGGTALYSAIYKGLKSFNRSNKFNDVIVAFTDGNDNSSGVSYNHLIKECQKDKIPVFCIGLGDADYSTLNMISKNTGGFYYESPNPNDLRDLYSAVSSNINSSYFIKFYWDTNDFPNNIYNYKVNFVTRVVSNRTTIAQYYFPNVSINQ